MSILVCDHKIKNELIYYVLFYDKRLSNLTYLGQRSYYFQITYT